MAAADQTATAASHATTASQKSAPIVVDLGKKSRKQIRQVREGTGKLMSEIDGVLEHLRATGAVRDGAQPILLVVKQKPRRSRLLFPLG
jgi:hypothetical protein